MRHLNSPLRNGSIRAARRSSGFTLVEIAASLAFIAVSLGGLSTLFLYTTRSADEARQRSLLTHRLRFMSETIRATPFADIAVTWQGQKFDIPELGAEANVTVFVNEIASSEEAKRLGFPRDLDGDGGASNTDVS